MKIKLEGMPPEITLAIANIHKYRLLTREDKIQADDWYLCDDCQTWEMVGFGALKFSVGCKYNERFFQPMRRRSI